jgi:hypothetical protein
MAGQIIRDIRTALFLHQLAGMTARNSMEGVRFLMKTSRFALMRPLHGITLHVIGTVLPLQRGPSCREITPKHQLSTRRLFSRSIIKRSTRSNVELRHHESATSDEMSFTEVASSIEILLDRIDNCDRPAISSVH